MSESVIAGTYCAAVQPLNARTMILTVLKLTYRRRTQLTMGRVHPRVGSGHVVLDLNICTFSYLTLHASLHAAAHAVVLPQGDGTDKRHSATSRLRH